MKRALFISILAALLGLSSQVTAQIGVDDEPSEYSDDETSGEYYGDESSGGASSGAASLEDARTSGGSVRLGGGSLGRRQIPESYTVRRGDTLWDITGHFYGNPWQWPRVWSYNAEITNPHWIYPDDTLRLVPEGAAEVRLPEQSARVSVTEGNLQPGSIFLRDQAYLDPEALSTFGEVVGSPEDHMLLTVYDEVYIQFEEDSDVRRGQELTVFRRLDSDDRSPEEEGELVRIFGTVELRSYDPETNVGRGSITEALDPIERGFEVANIPRRFELIPPRENATDVDAEVVAALRPLQLFGNQQVIFVNAGEEQGLELGNRFFIVRSGDEWREGLSTSEREAGASDVTDEPVEYPDEIVAEARVVNVRPNTAGLMVTRAITEIEIGDRAEMRSGY